VSDVSVYENGKVNKCKYCQPPLPYTCNITLEPLLLYTTWLNYITSQAWLMMTTYGMSVDELADLS